MSASNYQIMWRCLNCWHTQELQNRCRQCGFLMEREATKEEIEASRKRFMKRGDAND